MYILCLSFFFRWYKEAAEKGFAPAQYALSYLYKNGEGCEKNDIKAYYWLELSADNDFEDAFYILGQTYLEGNDIIETDYKKAFFYLSKGVNKKDRNWCLPACEAILINGRSRCCVNTLRIPMHS